MPKPSPQTALIVVDVQNDFCPGGRLAVPDGDAIVPLVNSLARRFATVVLTQDWHPEGHISFASTHGKPPFSTIRLPYGEQMLWPDHCTWGSSGAAFHPGLDIPHAQAVIRKGYHDGTDSYSAFIEADRRTHTGLAGFLREKSITHVVLCGLALDFCVNWSAQDARSLGFATTIIADACRAIDVNGSLAAARTAMAQAGVTFGTPDTMM